jgi:hypothetical protein
MYMHRQSLAFVTSNAQIIPFLSSYVDVYTLGGPAVLLDIAGLLATGTLTFSSLASSLILSICG